MANILFISINNINAEGPRLMSANLKHNKHSCNIIFLKKWVVYSSAKKDDWSEEEWAGINEKGKEFRYAKGKDISSVEKKILLDLISKIKPDIIGFSVNTMLRDRISDITTLIKENFDIPVVWGGFESTVNPKVCLKYCDFVLIGEGDKAIIDIANSIDRKKPLKKVHNMAFLEKNKLIRNPLNSLTKDLNSLPYKDISPKGKFLVDNNTLISNFSELTYDGGYHIASSRGCLFKCTFCSEHFFKNLYSNELFFRKRSVKSVISELKNAAKSVNYNHVYFWEAIFSYNYNWILEFKNIYLKEINKPFFCNLYPNKNTYELLPLLKETGLNFACLALQTGSNRINKDIFQRYYDKKMFLKVANRLKELKIDFYVDVITYNPFEEEEDLKATLNLLEEIPKPFSLSVNKLNVMNGCKIKELIENKKPKISNEKNKLFNYYARLFWLTNTSKHNSFFIKLFQRYKLFYKYPFLINPHILNYPYKIIYKIRAKLNSYKNK